METNYSVVGQEAQKLTPLNKAGIASFVIGILGLITLIATSILEKKSLGKLEITNSYILVSFGLMVVGAFLFTYHVHNFSFGSVFSKFSSKTQKLGLGIGASGFAILCIAWAGVSLDPAWLYLTLSLLLMTAGIGIYIYGAYAHHPKGIKNNYVWFNSLTSRGAIGWIAGILLTIFYIQLYWIPESLKGMIALFDPLSNLITGGNASQWFVYGTIYTFLITLLGIKFIVKYRHNRYQVIRTLSVIFFQVVFAYSIPHILEAFHSGGGYFQKDLKNIWPLNYGFVESYQLDAMSKGGVSGMFFFFWGLVLFLIITPVLTYFVGKRWYCSWVCGCGGLAETAGDGFRQLSSKKRSAWKIERWVIHLVMVFVLIMSVAVLWPYFSGKEYEIGFLSITGGRYAWAVGSLAILGAVFLLLWNRRHKNTKLIVGAVLLGTLGSLLIAANIFDWNELFYFKSKNIKKTYGFLIGAAFSGVIGVGFYPMLGNRVWCRFGCPMAGYMGIFQRFKSKFRITTNGSQCISCGNCSTYCEQGIDVRAYAQKGENIVRASCVGCGVCSAVCPRGVLKLENGPEEGRFDSNPLVVTKDGIKLNV